VSINSLSAKRLDELIAVLASGDTVGVDVLRDIACQARAITKEVSEPAGIVLAWVLMKKMESICDAFEADPMTVADSVFIVDSLRNSVRAALIFLNGENYSEQRGLALAAKLIGIAIP
jgi:hypothetical protein